VIAVVHQKVMYKTGVNKGPLWALSEPWQGLCSDDAFTESPREERKRQPDLPQRSFSCICRWSNSALPNQRTQTRHQRSEYSKARPDSQHSICAHRARPFHRSHPTRSTWRRIRPRNGRRIITGRLDQVAGNPVNQNLRWRHKQLKTKNIVPNVLFWLEMITRVPDPSLPQD
jgi:hypothetical protein